jgi:hypothetical protein
MLSMAHFFCLDLCNVHLFDRFLHVIMVTDLMYVFRISVIYDTAVRIIKMIMSVWSWKKKSSIIGDAVLLLCNYVT